MKMGWASGGDGDWVKAKIGMGMTEKTPRRREAKNGDAMYTDAGLPGCSSHVAGTTSESSSLHLPQSSCILVGFILPLARLMSCKSISER